MGDGTLASTRPVTDCLVYLVAVWGFFYLFFRDLKHLTQQRVLILGHALMHSVVLAVCVPAIYAFTYVNTVLNFALIGNQLLRNDKDGYYDRAALLVSLPIMLVTWFEPLSCDDFLIDWGGHLWFGT